MTTRLNRSIQAIAGVRFFMLIVFLLSSCQISGPVPNSLVISPSPVHILANSDGDIAPEITITAYLSDSKTKIVHVWLDVVASAKFGTQTLAARQEMTLIGRTRDGMIVYQWVIPPYLLETENIGDLNRDKIDLYVRVEDESGKLTKLDTLANLERNAYLLVPTTSLERTVLTPYDALLWQGFGEVDHSEYANHILVCKKNSQESIWSGKDCVEIPVSFAELQAGTIALEKTPVLKDGQYWWVIQRSDNSDNVVYQSESAFFLLDVGEDDWIAIDLDQKNAIRSKWEGTEILSWRIYRNGMLLAEQELSDTLTWNVDSLVQASGYYELMIVESGRKNPKLMSNVITIVVEDHDETLTLQEEFLLSDEEVTALTTIMNDLMTLPADQVEYFISRMAFQGVVDAGKLRTLLDDLGLSNAEIELMAERGQVEELTRIFAQAYVMKIFTLQALQQGLTDYIGTNNE